MTAPSPGAAPPSAGAPKQVLSLFDGVAITVGIVIGAGIFRLPSVVAGQLNDNSLILLVWLAGGVVSFIGALCYAELVTAYPSAGGEYHFLIRAYGRDVGFMFAWARMTVIQSGSIALFAYVFGDYAAQLLPLGPYSSAIYAVAAILALTTLNLAGVRETKTVQNVLFIATLVGLIAVITAGVLAAAPLNLPPPPADPVPVTVAGIGSAMLLVLLTYGGWNEAAYISAEVRNQKRNMVRALLISIAIITVLYVAVNYAYLKVLGSAGVAASSAVAADVMRAAFGETGAAIISLLILVVVLDNINITMFTGARSNYALGRNFQLFGFLGKWSGARGVPVNGVLLQSAIALGIVVLGLFARQGVQTVVDFLQPVFWLFFLLTGLSLFVLRRREPDADRPFRVPLYPLTPALFCLMGAYMLYSSLVFTGAGALAGVAVLALGLPFLMVARRKFARGAPVLDSPPVA